MMIGIDTVVVSRLAEAVKDEAFLRRVYTAQERAYCDGRARPCESYAGLFCAKEAAVKALKCGFLHGIAPTDIEITHDTEGAPVLVMHGKAAELLAGRTAEVSISHDGDRAVAAVLITSDK